MHMHEQYLKIMSGLGKSVRFSPSIYLYIYLSLSLYLSLFLYLCTSSSPLQQLVRTDSSGLTFETETSRGFCETERRRRQLPSQHIGQAIWFGFSFLLTVLTVWLWLYVCRKEIGRRSANLFLAFLWWKRWSNLQRSVSWERSDPCKLSKLGLGV